MQIGVPTLQPHLSVRLNGTDEALVPGVERSVERLCQGHVRSVVAGEVELLG